LINGERVRQVRELKGLTQTEFATHLRINQSAVAQIESGRIAPSDQVLQRIILTTGFPMSFFKQSAPVDFPLGSLLFRARATVSARERCESLQYTRTIFEIAEKMEIEIDKIPLRLPRFDQDPISAAIQTRSSLGLSPDTPITNLINTVEKSGVLVMALAKVLEGLDAFSAWVGRSSLRPVIVIANNNVPGDRLRFSVAHELGHLVMHQAIKNDIATIEREASSFASEFLMPKEAMLKEIMRPVTLVNLLPLKMRWKVSIQALIRRAWDLELITQRQYKYLMQQMSMKGMRKKEPGKVPLEKPRMISQMAELIYGIPIDYRKLASEMNVPAQLIKETLEVHAMKNGAVEDDKIIDGTSNKIVNFRRRGH